MRPTLVDFHCHLDLYPDLATAISACDARRAATLAVTTTPKAFSHNRQLASKSEYVRVALGLPVERQIEVHPDPVLKVCRIELERGLRIAVTALEQSGSFRPDDGGPFDDLGEAELEYAFEEAAASSEEMIDANTLRMTIKICCSLDWGLMTAPYQ